MERLRGEQCFGKEGNTKDYISKNDGWDRVGFDITYLVIRKEIIRI